MAHPHEGKVDVHRRNTPTLANLAEAIGDLQRGMRAFAGHCPPDHCDFIDGAAPVPPGAGSTTIHVNLVGLAEALTRLTSLEKLAMATKDELARIDAYTTELADDIDRLAAKIESADADTAAALKLRADALRLVADKSQPDVVPPPVEPLPPTT